MLLRLLRFSTVYLYATCFVYCCVLLTVATSDASFHVRQHNVLYITYTCVQWSQSNPWRTYICAYVFVHNIHDVTMLDVWLLTRQLVALICLLCACIRVRHSYVLNRMYVLPVLKHGPRSLMYVQVHSCDRTMHNRCNHIYTVINCRQICLNKSECEHMH